MHDLWSMAGCVNVNRRIARMWDWHANMAVKQGLLWLSVQNSVHCPLTVNPSLVSIHVCSWILPVVLEDTICTLQAENCSRSAFLPHVGEFAGEEASCNGLPHHYKAKHHLAAHMRKTKDMLSKCTSSRPQISVKASLVVSKPNFPAYLFNTSGLASKGIHLCLTTLFWFPSAMIRVREAENSLES